jgi:hypothetical protein
MYTLIDDMGSRMRRRFRRNRDIVKDVDAGTELSN